MPVGAAGIVVSGFHDVDQDVVGIKVGHPVRLVRLADASDSVADR
ncbi:hypothetical protein [Streptomyces tanashiensis]|nr:hypothetical protein [Streptomyces tanashiensis]